MRELENLQMSADSHRWSEENKITEKVIGAAYTVSNTLCAGFLEKVYENALCIELKKAGVSYSQQLPLEVMYDKQVVGEYFADILVENKIVVELKAIKTLEESHYAQCLNYLKATHLNIGLLINFGTPRIQIKRLINEH